MKTIRVGQVRPVTGGYGLMQVAEHDYGSPVVGMRGHGPATSTPHWFPVSRLGEVAAPEVVLKEFKEARARGVNCDNPDCWCREVTGIQPSQPKVR